MPEIRVSFINNEGAGFAGEKVVEEGTTASQLFFREMGEGASPADYLIRVNRQEVTASYALQPGDRMTVTPTKVQGA